jgi:glycosyltransferase involved in cell wall biosynthesis
MRIFTRFFLFIGIVFCADATEKKKIVLNMIVKNEEKVIERSLGSVKDFIDYWVIVDTGSTDKTIDVIKSSIKINRENCTKGHGSILHIIARRR